jgi:hypothetical protein
MMRLLHKRSAAVAFVAGVSGLYTLGLALTMEPLVAAGAAPLPPQDSDRSGRKAGGFVHPGITQNRAELDFMKRKVLAGEQPWKGAWDRLVAADYSALSFRPAPFAHVIRGAYGNPRIGADELQASANAAYSHALQWYVTGEPAHAQKVIEIFNAWAPVLQDFQQNDAKLLAGWTGYSFCNAAEILRVTDSGWGEADKAQFKKMLRGVYYPLLKDFFPEANGNWDAAIMSTLLAMGIFCDDRALFDSAVVHFIRGPMNGGITHYVYPSGQCQESTRDHGHTQLGLGWMARTARIAWTQGVDLFGVAGNRLALGFEYTAKYLSGAEVPAENVISPRQRFEDIYLPVYQHYHFERGMELPFTARAVDQTLGRASLSLVTMYRGPAGNLPRANSPASSAAPEPSLHAARSGALQEATATAPADAVRVAPGESIQAALESKKATGGWVVLGKGLHTLSAALRLPSGVTLAGEGTGTVLWMNTNTTGPALLNRDDDLHDVTLRDFVLEGAMTSVLPRDPNSARRARSRPATSARGGIQFTGRQQHQALENLRLEHVTVRNCTGTGLAIENARHIVLKECSFTDNGAPGPKPRHNVSLIKAEGCEITDSRLNNSPAGAGVYLFASREVVLVGNEIARNVLRGVHACDTKAFQVRDNLLEGNEAGGLLLDKEAGGCRRIAVANNLVRNNGGYAIDIQSANGGSVEGNRLADNAQDDQLRVVACENLKR